MSLDSILVRVADHLDPQPIPEPQSAVEWIHERLGAETWSKSREICESVQQHRKTAVQAAHSVSKSWTVGRIAAWWIDQHPPGTARVVTTAPSGDQVKAILWMEINEAHESGSLPGRVNQTEWWIGNYQAGIGRKPAEYNPTSFQGLHAEYMLVIVDEAGGVEGLWAALQSLAANEQSRIIAIGNPDNPLSTFAEICKPESGWNVIHIDGLESPNFTDEPVSDRLKRLLISQIYVQEIIDEFGEGSPIYTSKVRGLFPQDAKDGVVPYSWAKGCQNLGVDLSQGQVELGVDVGASEEGDPTIIRERRGNKAGRRWEIQSDDSEIIADLIQECIIETGAQTVKVDVIGVGFGVVGSLRRRKSEGKHGATIEGINVAESPKGSEAAKRFANYRSQIWWEIGRELSRLKAWDLTDVDDKTITQLVAPKYSETTAGLIVVEKKKETKKRLKRSPDDADALLLAFVKAASEGWHSGTMIADMRI